ncbi:MAG: hypothetical protein P8130_09695 [Deltaproteobacteria bacterium]
MQSSSKSAISSSSLSDTFAVPDSPRKRTANATQALAGLKKSIRQLKAIMLSLEWEMSVETLRQLDAEIVAQQERWQDDKSVTALLRILAALGNYIGRIQARTHPLAIKLFFAVYNGLEKIVLSPAMSAAKKKKIALLAYQRYNEVREKLTLRQKLIAQENKKSGSQPSHGEDLNQTAGDHFVIPALGDIDFSGEEEKKRKIWLENDGSDELTSRLSSFFEEGEGEDKASTTVETGDESPSLPERKKEQQGEEIVTHVAGQDETEISPPEKKKKGIIDDLFSSNDESPADQLLADMHLSVFTSDSENSAPVSFQDPPQNDVAQDKSQLETQVTEKLDAFFDESMGEAASTEIGQKEKTASSEESEEGVRENISEEAFAGELQEKLNSFFDDEGHGEVQSDTSIAAMQSPSKPGGAKSVDILQELIKEIRLQSDGYKHFPEAEERGLLSNLFERVEKANQDTPEILIPLCLLHASLFLFEGSKDATCKEALACAADLAGMLNPSDGEGVEKNDFAKIVSLLKKFLTVVKSGLPDSQAGPDSNKSDHGRSGSADDRPQIEKKSRSKSQPKAKGDLVIEDLFSDE